MWGWDRKICPEDHRLASRGLLSDDKRWSPGTDFLSHSHMNNRFFFLLTTKHLILYWNSVKKASRIFCIRWDAEKWGHFYITKTSWNGVRTRCCSLFFFLSHGLARSCVWEISILHYHLTAFLQGQSQISHSVKKGIQGTNILCRSNSKAPSKVYHHLLTSLKVNDVTKLTLHGGVVNMNLLS